jgi:RNA polymerase sigma factor (sigma-70 family)
MLDRTMSDQEVIKKCLEGDIEAYGLLMDTYQHGLFRHIYAMTKDSDLAEDICQESFIKAFQSLSKYDSNYKFSTWLYRIAINKTYDHFRKRKEVPFDESIQIVEEEYGLYESDRKQRENQVRAAIERLSPNYRTAISLYYWRQFKYEQIAEIMDIPVNTVRTWLHRAKSILKEELDGKL